jgi:DNA-directed RNA polymerase subunit RPC12/RpoP
MKAITCSQCGAVLTEFSATDKFAGCQYCGAKIRLRPEKIIEVSDNKVKRNDDDNLTPYQKHQKRRRELQIKYAQNASPGVSSHLGPTDDNSSGTLFVVVFVSIFIAIIIFAFNFEPPTNKIKKSTLTSTPTEESTSTEQSKQTKTPLPLPDITYRAYVKYNTALGGEHIQIPTIEPEQLPTYDEKEIKKTVFKQKRIRVRITINQEGEVTDAKALNGHKVLRESSVRAAKKSLFSARRRIGQSTLTYIFILEE